MTTAVPAVTVLSETCFVCWTMKWHVGTHESPAALFVLLENFVFFYQIFRTLWAISGLKQNARIRRCLLFGSSWHAFGSDRALYVKRQTYRHNRRQVTCSGYLTWIIAFLSFFSIGFRTSLQLPFLKKKCQSYLPDFVMTISVPSLWNFSHRSFPSRVTFGSSTTPSSSGWMALRGRMAGWWWCAAAAAAAAKTTSSAVV